MSDDLKISCDLANSVSTFLTIPLNDVLIFLEENQISKPLTNGEAYRAAWEIIYLNRNLVISPLAIKDFLIAYNSQDLINQEYRASLILSSSEKELRNFSDLFGLPVIRNDRIIRILGYLNLLVNDLSVLDLLPKDILSTIGSNLDSQSITTFRLISKRFSELFTNQEITEMLRASLHRTTSLVLTDYDRNNLNWLGIHERNKNRLACGYGLNLVLFGPNQVNSWGNNKYGQLGIGDARLPSIRGQGGNAQLVKITTKPRIIPGLKNIQAVAAGSDHSLVLDYQGRVYSFGRNHRGQLGLGHDDDINTPTIIPDLINITAIFARYNSSFALTNQGEIYEFGESLNQRNVLFSYPQLINLQNIVAVSPGYEHCLYLDSQGLVYGSGYNHNYQLGSTSQGWVGLTLIKHLRNVVGICSTRSYSFFLNRQGKIYLLGDNGIRTRADQDQLNILPVLVPGLNHIIFISSTAEAMLALDYQGQVWKIDYINLLQCLYNGKSPRLYRSNIVALQTIGDSIVLLDRQGELEFIQGNIPEKIDQLELY